MLGNWSIRVDAPGDSLYVVISVQHPTLGNYFTAALQAKLVGHTSNSLRRATFFWLMPHKVAAWIYWEVRVICSMHRSWDLFLVSTFHIDRY